MKIKIGLIGCGAIGQFLLKKINQEKIFPNVEIVSVLDEREKSKSKLEKLVETYHISVFNDVDRYLESYDAGQSKNKLFDRIEHPVSVEINGRTK